MVASELADRLLLIEHGQGPAGQFDLARRPGLGAPLGAARSPRRAGRSAGAGCGQSHRSCVYRLGLVRLRLAAALRGNAGLLVDPVVRSHHVELAPALHPLPNLALGPQAAARVLREELLVRSSQLGRQGDVNERMVAFVPLAPSAASRGRLSRRRLLGGSLDSASFWSCSRCRRMVAWASSQVSCSEVDLSVMAALRSLNLLSLRDWSGSCAGWS